MLHTTICYTRSSCQGVCWAGRIRAGSRKATMDDDVMNLKQAADMLGVSRQRLSRMIRAGETDIPCRRIGPGTYRFSRTAILLWLGSQGAITSTETVDPRPGPTGTPPKAQAREKGKRRVYGSDEQRAILAEYLAEHGPFTGTWKWVPGLGRDDFFVRPSGQKVKVRTIRSWRDKGIEPSKEKDNGN